MVGHCSGYNEIRVPKKKVFPELDDITICGKDQEEHDANLECFLEATERKNIT